MSTSSCHKHWTRGLNCESRKLYAEQMNQVTKTLKDSTLRQYMVGDEENVLENLESLQALISASVETHVSISVCPR